MAICHHGVPSGLQDARNTRCKLGIIIEIAHKLLPPGIRRCHNSDSLSRGSSCRPCRRRRRWHRPLLLGWRCRGSGRICGRRSVEQIIGPVLSLCEPEVRPLLTQGSGLTREQTAGQAKAGRCAILLRVTLTSTSANPPRVGLVNKTSALWWALHHRPPLLDSCQVLRQVREKNKETTLFLVSVLAKQPKQS